ncbi:hypothetical protein CTAYLR_002491 [Chrysophaeum taylorii]|uniref:Transmembrane protein 17 n=1 Tax=Chrysophaeum taylorii TaxID=2483200 RepID=A0AAD7XLD4_9STRA|nr:hypothetical protein CTAYLR_002491 [Chrysophaeum taylorii]
MDDDLVEIKSSLGLQVLMYYQGFFSLLYLAVSGGCLLNKMANYEFSNAILELVTFPIFCLWTVTEVARVGLGYVGNVKEKVPMVSAFLLLTIFPQLVAVSFFTFLQDPKFPFDSACGSIMLVFLVLELVIGKRTLDVLIARQTAQFFRLCQEAELERMRATDAAPSPSVDPITTTTTTEAVPPPPVDPITTTTTTESVPPPPPPEVAAPAPTRGGRGESRAGAHRRRRRPVPRERTLNTDETESLLSRDPSEDEEPSIKQPGEPTDDVTNPLLG